MIHGEIEPEAPAGTWSSAQLDAFRAQGIEVGEDGGSVKLTIPLDLAAQHGCRGTADFDHRE